ncbi:hypothetical protein SLE2022_315160 [Rubroshorea leprosula]
MYSYLHLPSTATARVVFLYALIWSLLSTASVGYVSDINCLRSIKDSLDDPHDRFKSYMELQQQYRRIHLPI